MIDVIAPSRFQERETNRRSTAQNQRTAFERQDGATEINPATTSAAETSESHPDPSFVAMLEQFRDATPAEQVFSQGPQEKL